MVQSTFWNICPHTLETSIKFVLVCYAYICTKNHQIHLPIAQTWKSILLNAWQVIFGIVMVSGEQEMDSWPFAIMDSRSSSNGWKFHQWIFVFRRNKTQLQSMVLHGDHAWGFGVFRIRDQSWLFHFCCSLDIDPLSCWSRWQSFDNYSCTARQSQEEVHKLML